MSKITPISGPVERVYNDTPGDNTARDEVRDNETLDTETMTRLRRAADRVATWEVVPRPQADGSIQTRVNAARQTLKQLEAKLAGESLAETPNDPQLTARRPALLELAASHRMFRSAIRDVVDKRQELARLPRLVGRGRALEIILGCADFNAETAERYGWVNRALPATEIDYFVGALAARIAGFPAAALAQNHASSHVSSGGGGHASGGSGRVSNSFSSPPTPIRIRSAEVTFSPANRRVSTKSMPFSTPILP